MSVKIINDNGIQKVKINEEEYNILNYNELKSEEQFVNFTGALKINEDIIIVEKSFFSIEKNLIRFL